MLEELSRLSSLVLVGGFDEEDNLTPAALASAASALLHSVGRMPCLQELRLVGGQGAESVREVAALLQPALPKGAQLICHIV